VEASEGESFEQGSEADCAKFNAKGKSGSKFTRPPTQKKGRNPGFILEVVRLHRSKAIQPIYRKIKVESPMLKDNQASTQRCALFVGPNIPCGDAANSEH